MSNLSKVQKALTIIRGIIPDRSLRQRYLRFNNFVVEYIFTTKHYQILERNMDPRLSFPTFTLRDLANGREFYLLAKFTIGPHQDKIKWCTSRRWKEYQQFSKQKPSFLLLGIGENPSQATSLYLLPFHKIQGSNMLPNYVCDFSIEEQSLEAENLWQMEKSRLTLSYPS